MGLASKPYKYGISTSNPREGTFNPTSNYPLTSMYKALSAGMTITYALIQMVERPAGTQNQTPDSLWKHGQSYFEGYISPGRTLEHLLV